MDEIRSVIMLLEKYAYCEKVKLIKNLMLLKHRELFDQC